jgi:hypothetical protein
MSLPKPTVEDLQIEFRAGVATVYRHGNLPDALVRPLIRMFCMGALTALKATGQIEAVHSLVAQLVPMMAYEDWDVAPWLPSFDPRRN